DEMFGKFYDDFYPHSTVFLVHQDFHALAKTVRNKYRPERSFIKVFKRWDFMLFFGGLYRAIDNGEEYDLRYHIPNFSSGYEASIIQRNSPNGRHLLLPELTRVPCDMQSFDGISQNLKIDYCAEYLQVFENLIWESRFAAEQFVKTFGSSKKSIGYVDERGVPYASPRNTNILAFQREKATPYAVSSNNHTAEPTKETNYTPTLEFAIDFLSANICEHNTSIKTKLIYENVFDPMKLSCSVKQLSDVLQKKPISTLHVITDENIPNEYIDLFYTWCSSVTYIPHIKAKLSY
uniref:Uncharacterized protein n=1 Tax=Panagrolaimus sp. PS1159 TaxID=55785 RepID=A0AC35FBR2_9BILA